MSKRLKLVKTRALDVMVQDYVTKGFRSLDLDIANVVDVEFKKVQLSPGRICTCMYLKTSGGQRFEVAMYPDQKLGDINFINQPKEVKVNG